MKRKDRIYNILKKNLENFKINIIDNSAKHAGHNQFDGTGETHIYIELKAKKTIKINRIKIHREINELLKIEFENGLHSLEIKINQA